MTTILIAADPAKAPSVVHHADKTYRPDSKGRYEVEDGHVADLRAHGLLTPAELETRAAAAKGEAPLAQRVAELDARVAALEGKKGRG